jgi:hypothetical protein
MSARFSLISWLCRLPLAPSCIDGDGRHEYDDYPYDEPVGYTKRYFALAEDFKRSHCPYPKLPRWCRRLFDARVFVSLRTERAFKSFVRWLMQRRREALKTEAGYTRAARCMDWVYRTFGAHYYRGLNWWFHCRECGQRSRFSLKNKPCLCCGHVWRVASEADPKWSALSIALRIERFFRELRWLRQSYRWRLRNWWRRHRGIQVTHLNAYTPRPVDQGGDDVPF